MHRLVLLFITAAAAVAGDGDRTPDPSSATGGAGTATPTGPGGFGGGFWILPLLLAFMYFILIRPQRKEEKRRKQVMADLKRGDRVVTIGGLHGEIVAVGETTVDVQAGPEGRGIVLTFTKSAVTPATAAATATATADVKVK